MLYKEELKKVPLCPIPKLSEEELKDKVYIAGVKITEINRCGKTLVVDYYSIKSKELQARFFSNGETYCCYNAKTKRGVKKYINSMLFDIKESPWTLSVACDTEAVKSAGLLINKTEDDHTYINYFGYHGHSLKGILAVTDMFIQECREKAREAANDIAEAKFSDRRLSCFKPNKDVDVFCDENIFDVNYIFFSNLKSDRKRDCYCSHCKKAFTTQEHPKHCSFTICPVCGVSALWIADRYQGTISNKSTICTAHKHNEELVLRWLKVERKFYNHKPIMKYSDDAYTIFGTYKDKPETFSYFYCTGYMYGGLHWTKERRGEICTHPAFIYPGNLNVVFGERYHNLDMKSIIANVKHKMDFCGLIQNIKNFPQTEYLCKLGLITLASEENDFENGKSFQEIMGVSKQYLSLYRKFDINSKEHQLIRSSKLMVKEKEFLDFKALCISEDMYDRVSEIIQYMSIKTLTAYIKKQMTASKAKTSPTQIVTWLSDYYSMCDDLDISICKSTVRPKNLKESHDLLTTKYEEVKADVKDRKSKAALELVNKWFNGYEKNGLCIEVPHYKSDFIREGEILHHCVGKGKYYENHIKGEKMVFFIRRVTDRETPYVTCEINMTTYRLLQCYGKGDSKPRSQVTAFAKEFCEWIKKNSKKELRKAG